MKVIREAKRLLPARRLCLGVLILVGAGTPAVLATGGQATQSSVPDPVTLSARELDIKEILSMLSHSRNLNIVCEEDVAGYVSIELHEVPFHEALRAVVAMAGFEVIHKGNIYFVRRPTGVDPGATIAHEVRTFRLDYAEPSEIQPVLDQILSPLGKVMSYAPLRALVVEDRPDVLNRVETVIRTLDLPPRQVLIEARMIEARLSKDMRFGIDWSLVFSKGNGSGEIHSTGFASPAGVGSEGFFVSWAAGDFLARLEAMDGIEELTTLCAPRLLAVDGAAAEIIIGGQLGFSVVTTVENTVIQSVEFLDTGAQLRITPTITGDGYILMQIHPELSDGVIEEGLPSKTTAQVTTDVLVKDGHTLFIGGLIREREESARKGIPILMRIPVLGALFGRTTRSVQRSELVTLITPRIVQPGERVPYEGAGLLNLSP